MTKPAWKNIKDHATKVINYEKKEMMPLTYKENEFYKKQKVCYICKKEFNTNKNDKNAFKLYHKAKDHCHYTGKHRRAAHNISNLRKRYTKRNSCSIS